MTTRKQPKINPNNHRPRSDVLCRYQTQRDTAMNDRLDLLADTQATRQELEQIFKEELDLDHAYKLDTWRE
jgi:hypothetical protein